LPPNSYIEHFATDGMNLFASIHEHLTGENKWDANRREMIFNLYQDPIIKGRGVFKSADNGATWREANAGLPDDPDVYSLIAKGTKLFAAIWGKGIYRSADGGLSWTVSNSGLPKRARFTHLAENGDSLFAGTYDHGLYVSRDDCSQFRTGPYRSSSARNEQTDPFRRNRRKRFRIDRQRRQLPSGRYGLTQKPAGVAGVPSAKRQRFPGRHP
jgi:hypothetical protein